MFTWTLSVELDWETIITFAGVALRLGLHWLLSLMMHSESWDRLVHPSEGRLLFYLHHCDSNGVQMQPVNRDTATVWRIPPHWLKLQQGEMEKGWNLDVGFFVHDAPAPLLSKTNCWCCCCPRRHCRVTWYKVNACRGTSQWARVSVPLRGQQSNPHWRMV